MLKILIMKLSLLHALSNGLWLMDLQAAASYEAVVNEYINGKLLESPFLYKDESDEKKVKQEAKAVFLTNHLSEPVWSDISKAPKGSVAVIPLQGPIMKQDFCGSPGLDTLQQWMQEADNNPNIVGQVMFTDSPGGSAKGVNAFSQFIKNLDKPVVSYVEQSCSGAYWINSATREIVLADELTITGSIGAFSTFYDTTKRDETNGVRRIEVYAPQSGQKNKLFRDIVAGNDKEYKEKFLKPLVEQFHATVKLNRHSSVSKMGTDVMEGSIFNGTDSIKNGLADRIGSFNSAVQSVIDLSKRNAA